MIGTTLAHYTILSMLGRGGMGEVWKAADTKLGREVAIKTLPAEFAQDGQRLARFEREARLLASVNHCLDVTNSSPFRLTLMCRSHVPPAFLKSFICNHI